VRNAYHTNLAVQIEGIAQTSVKIQNDWNFH